MGCKACISNFCYVASYLACDWIVAFLLHDPCVIGKYVLSFVFVCTIMIFMCKPVPVYHLMDAIMTRMHYSTLTPSCYVYFMIMKY